ncbi:MAG: ABC transporter permease subunit [Gammaproteobacteria bacterium]|nr:ABC transporter permease subunit [Gammaproteobacteria bacterium]
MNDIAANRLSGAGATGKNRHNLVWVLFAITVLVLTVFREYLPESVQWLQNYPKNMIVPLRFWISDFMKWLIEDFDLGLFTFKELTRSIAWLLEWPLRAAGGLLANGFSFSADPGAPVVLQKMPWLAVSLMFVLTALRISGWRLALFVGACFVYMAVFGRWQSAMLTLSSIAIAVPFGVIAGLLLGILGFRHPRFERAMTPVLDIMQTVPVFAYLVPILFLFGFGAVAAMIATMIYATPPMIRITILALKQVPGQLVEYGRMAGCTPGQLLWRVQVPAARSGLMVGVNQVIMLSLNMVIIASMIGAGGLGYDVLAALRRLDIGGGLEAGLAITLLAIALDRLSQALAKKTTVTERPELSGFLARNKYLMTAGLAIILLWIAGHFIPAIDTFPESKQLTTSTFWSEAVKWINVNYFDQLDAFKSFLLLNVMIPVKRFLLSLPWIVVVGFVAILSYRLGGWRLSLTTSLLTLFIVVTGQWQKAMVTVYLCGVSVLFATAIGIPLGMWASWSEPVHRVIKVMIDTLQTLPSFVYLIPVVMLFRVGDFSAMLAIIAYSIAPAIRYTIHGISQVPHEIIEASRAMGCTRLQILRRVQLPIALPEIMLGVNQTIMMALSMLVITALVGTRDLGQEVYIALTKADTGRGIVAGLAVAFIAITADRMIGAWVVRKKKQLGLRD